MSPIKGAIEGRGGKIFYPPWRGKNLRAGRVLTRTYVRFWVEDFGVVARAFLFAALSDLTTKRTKSTKNRGMG